MEENQQQPVAEEFTYFTPYSVDVFNFDNPVDIKVYMDKFKYVGGATKDLIFNSSTADFIQEELVPKFNLNKEQGREITRIIRDVLLADIFIGDKVSEIQKRLEINEGKAKQIASMIVTDLFTPALGEIKATHSARFGHRLGVPIQDKRAAESTPAPIQARPGPPPKTFSNPAVNLDVNKSNVLDLRNK